MVPIFLPHFLEYHVYRIVIEETDNRLYKPLQIRASWLASLMCDMVSFYMRKTRNLISNPCTKTTRLAQISISLACLSTEPASWWKVKQQYALFKETLMSLKANSKLISGNFVKLLAKITFLVSSSYFFFLYGQDMKFSKFVIFC